MRTKCYFLAALACCCLLGIVNIKIKAIDVGKLVENIRIGKSSETSSNAKKGEKKETIQAFMNRYSVIHGRRMNNTRNECKVTAAAKMKRLPKLLVNEEHKLVYCKASKAGDDMWCRVLLILSKYNTENAIWKMTSSEVKIACEKNVKKLSGFNAADQKRIMDTYTKVLFARHPLTRLISAYKDKDVIRKENIGKDVPRYREKVDDTPAWNGTAGTTEITFEDFIDLVLTKSSEDFYWNSITQICFPCNIKYDFIGHFEDILNDGKYILTKSHITKLKLQQSKVENNSVEQLKREFSTLKTSRVAELYHKYKYDFSLFGYDIPLNSKREYTN